MTASTSGCRSFSLTVICAASLAMASRTWASSHSRSALPSTFQASSGVMAREVYSSQRPASQLLEETLEPLSDLGMLEAVRHRRLQVSELRAAVVAGPLEAVSEDAIFREERRDGVGELNLASGAWPGLREMVEDAGRQDVPPDDGEIRRSRLRRGLLDDAHHAIEAVGNGLSLDDAVLAGLLSRDLLDRHHRRLVALEHLGHLLQGGRHPVDQVVGEDHRKHLLVDRRLGAQDRVAQAERLGLPDVDAVHRFGNDVPDEL